MHLKLRIPIKKNKDNFQVFLKQATFLVLLLAPVFLSFSALGGNVAASSSGNWNSASTWGGSVPASNDNVTIGSGKIVTVDITTAVCGKITFSGGTLIISDGMALTMGTDLTVSNGSTGSLTLNGTGTLAIPGALAASGSGLTTSFSPTSTINFTGTGSQGAQTIPAYNYGNIKISNNSPSGASFAATAISTSNIQGTLSVETSAILVLASTTSYTGVPLTLKSGATLKVAGTLPAGLTTSFDAASTVNFNGTSAQTIPDYTYGDIRINNTAGVKPTVDLTTSNLKGDLIVETGTFDTDGKSITATTGQTLQISSGATFIVSGASDFPTTFPTVSLGATSNVNFAGALAQTIPAYAYANITLGGSGVKTISDGASLTNLTFGGGSLAIASGNTVSISGTLPAGGTVSLSGSTLNFSAAGAQTIPVYTYGNIALGGSGVKTVSNGASVNDISFSGTATMTIGSGSTVNIAGSLQSGRTVTLTGSTLNFNAAGAQTIPAYTYGNIALGGSGVKTVSNGASLTNLTFGGGSLTVASGSTVSISGTLPAGGTVSLSGSTLNFSAAGAQTIPVYTYGNIALGGSGVKTVSNGASVNDISFSGTATMTIGSGSTVNIAGSLQSGKTVTLTGSTLNFNAAGAQTIPAYTYGNIALGGSGVKTVSSGASLTNLTFGGGSLTVASGSTVNIAGTLPAGGTVSLSGSTLNFNAAGAQTIPAYTYGNIALAGSGAKTVSNGASVNDISFSGTASLTVGSGSTVNIAGSLPSGKTVSLSGSTLNFNGAVAQTIPAYTYGSLILDKAANKTLSGDITVKDISYTGTGSGTFTVSAGQTLTVTGSLLTSGLSLSAGSVVELAGTSSQVLPAFTYSTLKVSNSAGVVLNGDVTVNTLLNLSSGVVDAATNTLTVGSSGTISGASANNYIKLSSGRLLIQNIGSTGRTGEILFPVGTSTYTPAYITNSGTTNNFSVSIADGIKDNNNNPITRNVVNKTWNVSNSTNIGVPNVTLKLQWNASDEVVDAVDPSRSFVRNASAINHFTNGAWERLATGSVVENGGVFYVSASGISSFSPFGVASNINPLPVELINFKALNKGGQALLIWETATEKDNKGFEVQASRDGKSFEAVGFVPSQVVNSAMAQAYEFKFPNANNGIWYFRLKQIDFSGDVSFSETQSLNFNQKAEVLQVYPNPFRDSFKVVLQLNESNEVNFELSDLTGKQVKVFTHKLQAGQNQITLQAAPEQPGGVYILRIKTDNEAFINRIVKF